jgi:hypothetical protein
MGGGRVTNPPLRQRESRGGQPQPGGLKTRPYSQRKGAKERESRKERAQLPTLLADVA